MAKNHNEKLADIFDQMLDGIYDELKKSAKEFDSTSVPLNLVERFHNIVKKNYRKGIKEQKKK